MFTVFLFPYIALHWSSLRRRLGGEVYFAGWALSGKVVKTQPCIAGPKGGVEEVMEIQDTEELCVPRAQYQILRASALKLTAPQTVHTHLSCSSQPA